MNRDLERAINMASIAHKDQVRKYSNVPYIVHPMRVLLRVQYVMPEAHKLHIAAVLHDTVEDTDVTLDDIEKEFGPTVASIVDDLTNKFEKKDYPNLARSHRKQLEFARIGSDISDVSKVVKLVDRIDNLSEMPQNEDFTHLYLDESVLLLKCLAGTHESLENELDKAIQSGYNGVVQDKLDPKFRN